MELHCECCKDEIKIKLQTGVDQMPAKSKQQQKYMGYELAKQRRTGTNDTGMSEKQLKEFAGTKRKGLPTRVKKKSR